MVKPEECSRCNSTELTYKEQYPVFNPDTDEEEIIDEVYKYDVCNTLHVDNKDFKFIQINIDTNKKLQLHDDCTIT